MSGYTDCRCCGETIIDELLCDSCHAEGCDISGDEPCEIPECLEEIDGSECCTRASWMSDNRWHSNCDEPCPNAGKSWDDPQALARFLKAKPIEQRVFRVPATWQRMSRIDESLRHAVSECRWDSATDKLVPCAPHLENHSHGYSVYYVGETIDGPFRETYRTLCAGCASKAEYEDERIVKQEGNPEDPDLYCEECNERIESDYAEDEHEARGILAKVENGETLTPEETSTARYYVKTETPNSINEDTIKGLKKAGLRPLGPDEQESEDDKTGE